MLIMFIANHIYAIAVFIQIINGIVLAPWVLYVFSTLQEYATDFVADIHCFLMGVKDSISSMIYNLRKR